MTKFQNAKLAQYEAFVTQAVGLELINGINVYLPLTLSHVESMLISMKMQALRGFTGEFLVTSFQFLNPL